MKRGGRRCDYSGVNRGSRTRLARPKEPSRDVIWFIGKMVEKLIRRGLIGSHRPEGKRSLIKNDVTRNDECIGGEIKATVPSVLRRIT